MTAPDLNQQMILEEYRESLPILDALKAVSLPAVEVHLSDINEREAFRHVSYAGLACIKTFKGLGFEGYERAICFLKEYLSQEP
mgnify:CR=1 FL=1